MWLVPATSARLTGLHDDIKTDLETYDVLNIKHMLQDNVALINQDNEDKEQTKAQLEILELILKYQKKYPD